MWGRFWLKLRETKSITDGEKVEEAEEALEETKQEHPSLTANTPLDKGNVLSEEEHFLVSLSIRTKKT